MKEYLDIVDESGNPTGKTVDRETAHAEGVPHRTTHLWLLRKKGRAVQILLQKRAEIKSAFPGCYDISSAGHIPAGEDFVSSALRELEEELGVRAAAEDLIVCGDRKIVWDDRFFGKAYHDRQYTRVFCMWLDREETDFVLQAEEVDSVRWMDFQACVEGVENGTFKNCIAVEELMMVKRAAAAGA